MNAGHFEQLSECWSSEDQPATYYRTTAARARRTPGRRHHVQSETISRPNDCSLRTAGGQSRSRRLDLSIGDQREIRRLYDWAEVVEIDEQELLII